MKVWIKPQAVCLLFAVVFFSLPSSYRVFSTNLDIVNECEFTVWPAILSNHGIPPLSTTGFALQRGETKTIFAPPYWGGRIWVRTFCSIDFINGKFTCLTGDCGTNKVACGGNAAKSPVNYVEFNLHGGGVGVVGYFIDLYGLSLVDGYNIPLEIIPQGGTREKCVPVSCLLDLNVACPPELKLTTFMIDGRIGVVGCKDACSAFNKSQYCCTHEYATPKTCGPSLYSQAFKKTCPFASTYLFDNKTIGNFSCANAAGYSIVFCPSISTNTSNKKSTNATLNMVNEGEGGSGDQTRDSPSTFAVVLSVIGLTLGIPGFVWSVLQIYHVLSTGDY